MQSTLDSIFTLVELTWRPHREAWRARRHAHRRSHAWRSHAWRSHAWGSHGRHHTAAGRHRPCSRAADTADRSCQPNRRSANRRGNASTNCATETGTGSHVRDLSTLVL